MKHWLLFVAGLLAGGAGGLLLGGMGGKDDGQDGAHVEGNRRALWSGSGGTGGSLEGRGGRPGRPSRGGRVGGAIGGPARASDLLSYLESLAMVDDFEEVNFMQLLRHGAFVTSMSEREVADLLATLTKQAEEEDQGHNSQELSQIFSALLFARMMELNGPDAIKMMMAGEMGARWNGDEDELLAIGMSSWVDADPEGAAKWFRGAEGTDPKFRELFEDDTVQNAFFAAMARHDTKIAMSLALEAGEEVSSESMEVIARYEKTVEGLEDMLQGTSGEAQLEVFEIMSNRDPQAAARWLEGEGALDERDQYVEAAASSMMDHDSDAGIAWYMRQEIATEEGEADRIEHIVGRLANESPGTASTWLEGQPDTPARDGAEVNMARFATRVQDWETSFRWAAEVGNARQQTETVNWVLRRGWDPSKKSMNEQVAIAAEEAGFGAQLNAFLLERIASSR
ncbi:MAG: hypothetical protein VCA38_13610 [Roseibacillus sp.]